MSEFNVALITADLVRTTDAMAKIINAPLRTKCALVEAVHMYGKPVDQLTVRELVDLVQTVNP